MRQVTTARLELRAVTTDDVDDLFALSNDPRVWRHLPSGRHLDRDRTSRQVDTFVAGWRESGLGYWTARLRETGEFAGVGGCGLRSGPVWNLYYRFRPELQGQGLASELVAAARAAAIALRPDVPVVAYLVEHNTASRRLAERSGLTLMWSGPDTDNPDPGVRRLVFADRELTADELDAVVSHA